MNKSDFVHYLTQLWYDESLNNYNEKYKQANVIVGLFFDELKKALLSGEKVEIRGMGTFLRRRYSSYTGRNPKTGEKLVVAAKYMPFFRVSKLLIEDINKED